MRLYRGIGPISIKEITRAILQFLKELRLKLWPERWRYIRL
jgi:hypothetical protein